MKCFGLVLMNKHALPQFLSRVGGSEALHKSVSAKIIYNFCHDMLPELMAEACIYINIMRQFIWHSACKSYSWLLLFRLWIGLLITLVPIQLRTVVYHQTRDISPISVYGFRKRQYVENADWLRLRRRLEKHWVRYSCRALSNYV